MSAREEDIKNKKNIDLGDVLVVNENAPELSKEAKQEEPKVEVQEDDKKVVEKTESNDTTKVEAPKVEAPIISGFTLPGDTVVPDAPVSPTIPQAPLMSNISQPKVADTPIGFGAMASSNPVETADPVENVKLIYAEKRKQAESEYQKRIDEINKDEQRELSAVEKNQAYDRMLKDMTNVNKYLDNGMGSFKK